MRQRFATLCRFRCLISSLAICAIADAQPVVIQVPPMMEGGSMQVTAMSADGQYVVGYGDAPDGLRAFRWRIDSPAAENLGCLEGCEDSGAVAVSADGSVVVGNSLNTQQPRIAFRWTQAAGMAPLGDVAEANNKYPNAVSGDGSVVAGNMLGGSGAFRWTPGSGYQPLQSILGQHAQVWAISTDGLVIVGYVSGYLEEEEMHFTRAAKWHGGGAPQLLDKRPLTDLFASVAKAVNADGSHITGRFAPGTNSPQGYAFAVRWVAGSEVDVLFEEFDYSWPMGVTADGSVCVFFTGLGGGDTTLWHESYGFITLSRLLSRLQATVGNAVFGPGSLGVDMISDDGSRIVGVGLGIGGPSKSWVVKDLRPNVAPPELCSGDANGDSVVNFQDMSEVLNMWGADYSPDTGPGDANFDGLVNFQDITQVIAAWNYTCFAPPAR